MTTQTEYTPLEFPQNEPLIHPLIAVKLVKMACDVHKNMRRKTVLLDVVYDPLVRTSAAALSYADKCIDDLQIGLDESTEAFNKAVFDAVGQLGKFWLACDSLAILHGVEMPDTSEYDALLSLTIAHIHSKMESANAI